MFWENRHGTVAGAQLPLTIIPKHAWDCQARGQSAGIYHELGATRGLPKQLDSGSGKNAFFFPNMCSFNSRLEPVMLQLPRCLGSKPSK